MPLKSLFNRITKRSKARDFSGGAMISLDVPRVRAELLADMLPDMPEGSELVEPSEYHITLGYLGRVDELSEAGLGRSSVSAELRYEAGRLAPIAASVNGVARFEASNEGMVPLVVLVDSSYLSDFRSRLASKFPVNRMHGFMPHITVAYIPVGSSIDLPRFGGMDFQFDELSLHWGDRIERHRFSGESVKAQSDAPNYRVAAQPTRSCANCTHYDGANCDLYDFAPRPDWVCNSYEAGGRGGGATKANPMHLYEKGRRLAAYLNRQIDSIASEERSRSDIIGSMATAAGISRGTVTQILAGDIDRPPERRLRGFARVLNASFDEMTRLANADAGGATEAKSSLTITKADGGEYRWSLITATAHKDRDEEWIATKALQADAERCDATGDYGPLVWWHAKAANGAYMKIGDCDYNAVIGPTLVESGTFISEAVAKGIEADAANLKASIGFLGARDKANVFQSIEKRERSLAPASAVRNGYTALSVHGEKAMITQDQLQGLLDRVGPAGLTDVLNQVEGVGIQAAIEGNQAKAATHAPEATDEMDMADFAAMIANGVGASVQKAVSDAMAPVAAALQGQQKAAESAATGNEAKLATLEAQIADLEAKRASESAAVENKAESLEAQIKKAEEKLAGLSAEMPVGVKAMAATDGLYALTEEQVKALEIPASDFGDVDNFFES